MASDPRPPRKEPRDYRPDLRPMIIVGAVLLIVILGWVILSPAILPR